MHPVSLLIYRRGERSRARPSHAEASSAAIPESAQLSGRASIVTRAHSDGPEGKVKASTSLLGALDCPPNLLRAQDHPLYAIKRGSLAPCPEPRRFGIELVLSLTGKIKLNWNLSDLGSGALPPSRESASKGWAAATL
jgi:hypothetical protein